MTPSSRAGRWRSGSAGDSAWATLLSRDHDALRRRFSLAHEYCHALLERGSRGAISCQGNRDDLREVRANAFAANLLMPSDEVRGFLQSLGKGRPSRLEAEVYDGAGAVRLRDRSPPRSQVIQIYDLVQLAHHFHVSRASAAYRLRNLRLVTGPEFAKLLEREKNGAGQRLAELLDLPDSETGNDKYFFRRRFVGLGLEAFRRGEITRSKLVELGELVEFSPEVLDHLLEEANLMEEEEVGVLLPGR